MPLVYRKPKPLATKVILVDENDVTRLPEAKILDELKFRGMYKEVVFLPESNKVYIGVSFKVGAKTTDPYIKIDLYELGVKVIRALDGTTKQDFLIEDHLLLQPSLSQQINTNLLRFILGMHQAAWNFDHYLAEKSKKTKILEVSVVESLWDCLTDSFHRRLEALSYAQVLTRGLVDETPEYINPQSYPEIVKTELSHCNNVTLKFLDYQELQDLGMEGIVFVGRASRYKPVMVHATLKPQGTISRRICLVGKGLTYDSGGMDIKTDGYMADMKTDMAGSATMFGVIKALAEIGLEHTEVHWISAFAENMVDQSSYKADDIITTYSGQTVEIRNTDAEGRLTLADALAYATLLDPDAIIDAATLTGAAIMAVSNHYTALMANDRELAESLLKTFEEEGELTVHTPLPEILRKSVSSKIADLNNTSNLKRQAGHLTAGLFLSHFVDQNYFRNSALKIEKPKAYPWVHLDIAGSSHNNKQNSLDVHGATGQSVRSLTHWILTQDQVS